MLTLLALLGQLSLSIPAVKFAPTDLTVKARVKLEKPKEGHLPPVRIAVQVDDGENYFRYSDEALQDRSWYQFEFRNVPPGHFVVTVAVYDREGNITERLDKEMDLLCSSCAQ